MLLYGRSSRLQSPLYYFHVASFLIKFVCVYVISVLRTFSTKYLLSILLKAIKGTLQPPKLCMETKNLKPITCTQP